MNFNQKILYLILILVVIYFLQPKQENFYANSDNRWVYIKLVKGKKTNTPEQLNILQFTGGMISVPSIMQKDVKYDLYKSGKYIKSGTNNFIFVIPTSAGGPLRIILNPNNTYKEGNVTYEPLSINEKNNLFVKSSTSKLFLNPIDIEGIPRFELTTTQPNPSPFDIMY